MSGAISMYVPTAIIAATSLPLALNLVPPNRGYGFRTAKTLANEDVWFRVNRVAGISLLVAAGIAAGFYLAKPGLASGESLPGVLALVVPVVAALAITSAYARKLPPPTG